MIFLLRCFPSSVTARCCIGRRGETDRQGYWDRSTCCGAVEWQQCCRIYLPVLVVFAVSFGLMGYGMGARSAGWLQAGTVTACLCMVWGFVRNLQLDLFWNDRPHPRQRAWPLSLLWLTAAIGLPMLAMELGGLLGAR